MEMQKGLFPQQAAVILINKTQKNQVYLIQKQTFKFLPCHFKPPLAVLLPKNRKSKISIKDPVQDMSSTRYLTICLLCIPCLTGLHQLSSLWTGRRRHSRIHTKSFTKQPCSLMKITKLNKTCKGITQHFWRIIQELFSHITMVQHFEFGNCSQALYIHSRQYSITIKFFKQKHLKKLP